MYDAASAAKLRVVVYRQGIQEEDLLAAFLSTLASAAPSLQVKLPGWFGCTLALYNLMHAAMASSECVADVVAAIMQSRSACAYMQRKAATAVCNLAAWLHVQALRLDRRAAQGLMHSNLLGISSMGHSLRHLALIGLLHVSDFSVKEALEQLPMLQVRRIARIPGTIAPAEQHARGIGQC